MADQLLLYDATLAAWIHDQFGGLIDGKPVDLLIGTPDRAFARYVSHLTNQPYGVPPVPRMALTLGDPEEDPQRFNPNTIRKLGYSDSSKSMLRQAEYPVSIKIPYTLNLWTEYRREMNLLVQKILKLFRYQYTYIPVNFDSITTEPVYGTKDIGLFSDGSITASGTEDPGEKDERIIRRTFPFHMKAWLWDIDFQNAYVVKDVELRFYRDNSMTQLCEVLRVPQRSSIFFGTGSQQNFSGTLDRTPVIQQTLLVDAIVGGLPVRMTESGSGVLTSPSGASGTIVYSTGALTLHYPIAPDNGTVIEAAYFTQV